jgi:hypothetical protein
MPVTKGEQRGFIAFGIGLLFVMSLVAWMSSDPSTQGEGSPSSYSTQPNGAKAAYLLLQKNSYAVERWKQPPAQLPSDASGVMLVVAGAESYPRADELSEITRFLLRGGSVLVAGVQPGTFVPQASSEVDDLRVGFAECKPVAPTRLTRGGSISQDGDLVWDSNDNAALVHYLDKDDKPVVVSYALGKGQVIWWASALPLTNVGIRDRHNLDLLLNSIGDSRRLLWDEYYHEEHAVASTRTWTSAQKWALAQTGFIGLLVILTFSRRSGPIIPLKPESRLSPLEFVETLGSVFHRAKGTQVAVEIAFSRFQQIAARRLGIRGSANANDILAAMAQRGLKTSSDIADLVGGSEDAAGDTELSEKRALEHVQALNRLTEILDPSVSTAQKKIIESGKNKKE